MWTDTVASESLRNHYDMELISEIADTRQTFLVLRNWAYDLAITGTYEAEENTLTFKGLLIEQLHKLRSENNDFELIIDKLLEAPRPLEFLENALEQRLIEFKGNSSCVVKLVD